MNLDIAAQNGIRDLEKQSRSARSVSLQLRYRANRLRNGIGEYDTIIALFARIKNAKVSTSTAFIWFVGALRIQSDTNRAMIHSRVIAALRESGGCSLWNGKVGRKKKG